MTGLSFDRGEYFDAVRAKPFGGSLTQQQVDGQEAILAAWERRSRVSDDLRWLAYPLATTCHETDKTMWPIEEYGKGRGQPYGKPDPETGMAYYGRGFVQLTWKDNYQKATDELELWEEKDLVWHPENALDLDIASNIMFIGMEEGWFRSGHKLSRYFNAQVDDAFNAREIINGDKKTVPSWSHGASIGNLIKGYHGQFLAALQASVREVVPELPEPVPETETVITITVLVGVTGPAKVSVKARKT